MLINKVFIVYDGILANKVEAIRDSFGFIVEFLSAVHTENRAPTFGK